MDVDFIIILEDPRSGKTTFAARSSRVAAAARVLMTATSSGKEDLKFRRL